MMHLRVVGGGDEIIARKAFDTKFLNVIARSVLPV
jgi:hypothetical protein